MRNEKRETELTQAKIDRWLQFLFEAEAEMPHFVDVIEEIGDFLVFDERMQIDILREECV